MPVSGRAPGPHLPSGVAAGKGEPVADIRPDSVSPPRPTASDATTTTRRRRAARREERREERLRMLLSTTTRGTTNETGEDYGRFRSSPCTAVSPCARASKMEPCTTGGG